MILLQRSRPHLAARRKEMAVEGKILFNRKMGNLVAFLMASEDAKTAAITVGAERKKKKDVLIQIIRSKRLCLTVLFDRNPKSDGK